MARRGWVDFWLNISNISALLLFGLGCVEVFGALALMAGHAASNSNAVPGVCRTLGLLWPDRDATIALLNGQSSVAGVIFCATNLVPRIFYIGTVLIGFVWMTTYFFVRASQSQMLFPLIVGDDFIRLFILAIGFAKFGTDRYVGLAAERTSTTLVILIYILISVIQALFIVWFQRRLNERTHIASRD